MSSLPKLNVAPATAPTWLGRYQLLDLVGTGGMAQVHRAWDPLLGVHRAVKILHREAAAHWSLRARFLGEARTLTRLVHPNVLRVYEVGEDEDRCWYSMDLVEEGSLQTRLDRDGPFPVAEAMRIVFEVLQALGATHDLGIVHRDVKPNNVLMRADGSVVLGDFGSARLAQLEQRSPSPQDFLTRTGDALGTIGYMSPEQRTDARKATPQTDLYAVGATLFGLVTGRAPLGLFEGQLDSDYLARLHPEVRELIRNATRYKPEHRYPSARHMAIDLARAYDRMFGHDGPDAARNRWMARYDLLMETCARMSGQAPIAAEPAAAPPRPAQTAAAAPVAPERTRAQAQRTSTARPPTVESDGKVVRLPPPAQRAAQGPGETLPGPTPAPSTGFFAAIAAAGSRLFSVFSAAEAPPETLAGVWEGRVAGILPLRLELEEMGEGRLQGWAVTTGLKGQVITRVEGWWDPQRGSVEIAEASERPDRGRYLATRRGNTLEGGFQPDDPTARAMTFTLTRREPRSR